MLNKIPYAVLIVLLAAIFFLYTNIIRNDKPPLPDKEEQLKESYEIQTSSVHVKNEVSTKNKIILIGIDGADKNEIDKLISLGKLPNLQKLITNGAYGNLKSIKPLLSPLIWTSIITGKEPLKHGITDFLAINKITGKEIPVSSNLRRTKALWNIFSAYNRQVDVVGWLVTWPAEIINGVMISDHITYLDYDPHRENNQLEDKIVYPENIINEIKSETIDPFSISFNKFSNFIKIDKNKFESELKNKESKIYKAVSIIASTETINNISIHLKNKNQSELLCIYFKGIDSFSHIFAESKYSRDNSGINPISQFYIYQDEMIGEILKSIDENTTIIVVSDHGFKLHQKLIGSSEIGKGSAADWHNDNGIIIASGNTIKKGLNIENATVLDIAPTVLYLSRLPVAEDLKGKILKEIIDENYLKKNSVKKIKSFENKSSEIDENPIVSKQNEKIKEELETLGYLNTGTANSFNNIGNLYMNKGNFKLAVQSFKKAIELAPDVAAYYDNLGSAYKELKLFDEAIITHKKAISIDPYSAKTYNNLGRVFAEKNEMKFALQYYKKAIELNPSLAETYNNLGEMYHKQGKIDEAISYIEKAIQISRDHSLAHYNLAVLLGEKNNHAEAITEFNKVLKNDPDFNLISNVYNGIGVAYFKLQEYKKALEFFNKTLESDSLFHEIHLRLGIASIMTGKKDEGVKYLKEELRISPANIELANLIQKLQEEKEKINAN